MPCPAWWAVAFAVDAGEWPAIAPVSPSAKSMYSWPSTSTMRAPWPCAAKTGWPPAQRIIHGIGTPPISDAPARS